MPKRRPVAAFACSLLVLLGSASAIAPAKTFATTGPTHFLPASKYQVGSKTQRLYIGQYVLRTATAARLSGGAMGVEINDHSQLYGVAQFYTYDDQGHQSTWVGTLYNFHLSKNKEMIIDVLGPTGTPLLARLFVLRAKSGDLSGQISLANHRYPISWHKLISK